MFHRSVLETLRSEDLLHNSRWIRKPFMQKRLPCVSRKKNLYIPTSNVRKAFFEECTQGDIENVFKALNITMLELTPREEIGYIVKYKSMGSLGKIVSLKDLEIFSPQIQYMLGYSGENDDKMCNAEKENRNTIREKRGQSLATVCNLQSSPVEAPKSPVRPQVRYVQGLIYVCKQPRKVQKYRTNEPPLFNRNVAWKNNNWVCTSVKERTSATMPYNRFSKLPPTQNSVNTPAMKPSIKFVVKNFEAKDTVHQDRIESYICEKRYTDNDVTKSFEVSEPGVVDVVSISDEEFAKIGSQVANPENSQNGHAL